MDSLFSNQTIEPPVSGYAFSAPILSLLEPDDAWSRLQDVLSQGLLGILRSSGTDAQVWVAATEGFNAQDEPCMEFVVLFTSLVPLPADSLAQLHSMMAEECPALVPYGPRSLDEVNPFPSLACHQGAVHQVWVEDDGQLVAFKLGLDDDGDVRVFGFDWPLADRDGFLAGLPHLVLHFQVEQEEEELGDEERHLVCLQVAFTWNAARQLTGEGHLRSVVHEALDALFPPELLVASGFMGADGAWLEEAFQVALLEARQVLPTVLTTEQRLNIVQRLLELALLDGNLTAQQARTVSQAVTELGLSPDDLSVVLPAEA